MEAVFEDGDFKPLGDMKVKEHEKVPIRIIPLDACQARFSHVSERIQKKAAQFSPEEIDADHK